MKKQDAEHIGKYIEPDRLLSRIEELSKFSSSELANKAEIWINERYTFIVNEGKSEWIDLKHVFVSSRIPGGAGGLVGFSWEVGQTVLYPSSAFRNEDLLSNAIGAQANLINLLSPVSMPQIIYNRILSYGTSVSSGIFINQYQTR